MAITDKLGICALAMGWLGANAPTDLDTPVSTEDILCAENYDICRDAVLEDAEWSSAIKRTLLDTPVVDPNSPFNNTFVIPADCIRVLQAGAEKSFHDHRMWTKEADNIHINLDKVYIRYVSRIEDVTTYAPSLIQLIAARIAADLAVPITNSAKVEERRWAIYQSKLEDAMANDGRVGKSRILSSSALLTARHSYGASGYMGPYV